MYYYFLSRLFPDITALPMATCLFDTADKRKHLPARKEPYWWPLAKGRFLGYRKTSSGGSWIARAGKKQKSLGGMLSFQDAIRVASDWIDGEQGTGGLSYTVRDALRDYADDMSIRKSARTAREAESRILFHLRGHGLLDREVAKLERREIEDWRNSMVAGSNDPEILRKSKDSANRVMSVLKAALNLAFRSNESITSNQAWTRVPRFRQVARARGLFLSDRQVAEWLDAAERPFRELSIAAFLTGARYGELAAASVRDLNESQALLKLTGKTGARQTVLSDEALEFFRFIAKDKSANAPLLTGPDRGRWKKNDQRLPMQRVKSQAGLPQETVFSCTRHYYAARCVKAGIATPAIARNLGSSVSSIEQMYGHLQTVEPRKLFAMLPGV